jgi:hypothetical protein
MSQMLSLLPNPFFLLGSLLSPFKLVLDRNLICKDQFGGSAGEEASMHLHDFGEICDIQKVKNIDNAILKLKLFSFSLKGKAKEWLLYLPNGSINSWENLKEAFIKRYYPL